MAMYELDGNHLLPVRLGRSADAITLSHSLVAIQRQIVDVLRRPLFPLAWDQVNGGQSLTALDATGQVVVVEVLESVDSTGLLAAMSRLTAAAAAGRREIASRYAGGLGAFSRDWNEFREAMPAQVEAGPRLTILSASLEPDVVGGLGVLASSGLEIHEVDVRIVDESRIVVVVEKISGTDMAAGGPLLVARAPRPALAGSSGPGGPTGSRAMNALEQAEQVSPVTGPIEIVLPQEPAGEPDTDAGDSAVPIGAFAATGAADALSEMFEPVAVTAEQPQVHAAAADRAADRAQETAGDAAAALDDGASDSSTDSSTGDSRTDSTAGSSAGSTAGSSGGPAADDPGVAGHDAVDGRPEHTMEFSQGSSGDSSADVVSERAGNADAIEPDASDVSDAVNAVDGPGGASRSSGDPGDRDGDNEEGGKNDKNDKADDEQSGTEATADGSGGQDLTDVLNRNSVAGPITTDSGDEPGADDVDHDGPGSSDGASDSTERSAGEPSRTSDVRHVHHAHHADPSDDTSAGARTVAASAGSAHSDAQLGAAASDDAAGTATSHASAGDSEATDAPNEGDSRSRMGRRSREAHSQARENAPVVSPTSHAAAPASGASDVTETGEREARPDSRESAPAVSPTSHAAAPASGASDVTETGEHSVQSAEAWSTVAPNEGRPEEPTTAAVPLVSWEPLRGSADALDPVAEALGGDPSKSLLVQETAELAAVAATLGGPTRLIWQRLRRGIYHEATLSVEGVITLSDGRSFTDPTSAANAAQDVNDADGWRVWRVGVRGAHLGDLRDSLADRSS